jgi:putative hydrolase of the HAD superfamily
MATEIRGIIFDLGSTLIEYESIPWDELGQLCLDAGYEYLKESGCAVPDKNAFISEYVKIRDVYRKHAGETLEEWVITDAIRYLLQAFGLNGSRDLVDSFFAAYHVPLARQVTMFPEAPTVIRDLKNNGYKIGLVSNTIFPEKMHIDELEKFGLFPMFDFTVFSSSFGKRKPHPDIYGHAVNLMGFLPEELLFVGDRYIEDYQGPIDFGMKAIIKFRRGREYPEPMPDGVAVIGDLTELLAYPGLKIDDK